jgi:dihydroflavonol-4-reductase
VALCRNPESLAGLRHPALRIAAGDLRDPASWAPLLSPRGSVFHLAGVRNHPRSRVREMEEVNVAATLALAGQAGETGVARFVYVATALIYGSSEEGRARTEEDELDRASTAYVRSKAEAVLGIRALAQAGLPAVTVCPSIVFGPDPPSHPNRVTSEIRRLLRGGARIWLAGGRQPRNLVFVDDVVGGLLAAEERGVVGEEYLLGGEEISPRELAERVLALAPPRGGMALSRMALSLPAGAALGIAGIVDRLCGHDPGGGYATAVRTLLRDWRFSSGKARRDLGYQPLPLMEGLNRTIEWIHGRGDDRD